MAEIGLRPGRALADDLDVRFVAQQRQHARARHRLVVDDQRANLRHATPARTIRLGDRGSTWKGECDRHAEAVVEIRECELVGRRIQMLEPRARVVEADAPVERHQAIGRQSVAAVANLDRQAAIPSRAAWMAIHPGPRVRRDAVADRVLDQRLQQQVRHLRVERFRLDVHATRRRLPNRVCSISRYFCSTSSSSFSGTSWDARRVQRHPQQIAEAIDHHVGGVRRSCASGRRSCSAC